MQQQTSSKKPIIIFIVIVVIAFAVYFYFSGKPTDNSATLENTTTPISSEAEIAGGRVLSLLNQINSLKIDSTIFNNPTYKSLVDYSVEIPEQNVGRANPFSPVPGITPNPPKTSK